MNPNKKHPTKDKTPTEVIEQPPSLVLEQPAGNLEACIKIEQV